MGPDVGAVPPRCFVVAAAWALVACVVAYGAINIRRHGDYNDDNLDNFLLMRKSDFLSFSDRGTLLGKHVTGWRWTARLSVFRQMRAGRPKLPARLLPRVDLARPLTVWSLLPLSSIYIPCA